MEKFVHWVVDENGKPLHNVDITANLAGTTTKATLFSNRAGTISLTNPFKSEVDGSFLFYVAPGRYDIIRSKTGITFDDNDLADIRIGGDEIIGSDVISPYVVSGLNATVTGTDANVTIAPGTAYNIQRLHTTTNTILTVTNTGVAHTEYVSVNTAGALIITTTPRAADELPIADVSVDAAGIATAVTDVRQLKLQLKTVGVERLTVNKDGRVGIGTMSPQQKLHVIGNLVTERATVSSIEMRGNRTGELFVATFAAHNNAIAATEKRSAMLTFRNVDAVNYDRGTIELWTNNDGALAERMRIDYNGNVGIGTPSPGNILTVRQTSATDPIADAWTIYSLRKGKTILKDVGILDFDKTPVRRWKRKLAKPKLADFEEIREEAEDGVECVRTCEDQLADALKEYNKKKGSQKFTQEQFGLIAEEAPDCLKAYDDNGELVGIDTSAYVGWLHAVVKEQDMTIKDLTIRVQALEQVLTRNRSIAKKIK